MTVVRKTIERDVDSAVGFKILLSWLPVYEFDPVRYDPGFFKQLPGAIAGWMAQLSRFRAVLHRAGVLVRSARWRPGSARQIRVQALQVVAG